MPDPVAQTLAKLGIPLIKKLAAKLLDQTIPERAISATVDDFPGIEIHQTLRDWCHSDSFTKLLDRLIEKGERGLDEKLVESFVNAGFYHGDDTHARAAEVLQGVFRRLVETLYGSEKAIPTLAGRVEYVAETITTIRAILDRSAGEPLHPSEDLDPTLVARIDAARDLLNKGRPSAALDFLEPLEAKIREGAMDGRISYRVVMNLGVIATMARDYGKAQRYFNSALVYRPDDPKALANLAQVALLQGQTKEAFDWIERARRVGPSDAHVAAIFISCLQAQSRLPEIEALIVAEAGLLTNAQCALAVGEAMYRLNRFEEAKLYAQTALDLDATTAQGWDLMGRVELASSQLRLRADPPLPWLMSQEDRESMRWAEDSFSRAITILEKQEDIEALAGVVSNRGLARMMLGDASAAVADFDRALSLDNRLDMIRSNKGRMLVGDGRFDEAVSAFEGITDPAVKAQAAYPLATAYVLAGRPRNALPLLVSLKADEAELDARVHITGLLINVYEQLGRSEDAALAIAALESEMPDDVNALIIVGHTKDRAEDEKTALAAFEKALSRAKGQQKDLVVLTIADFHLRHHHHDEAAAAYKKIIDPTNVTPVTARYLFAAVQAGRLQEALELSQNIRAAKGVVPEVTEFEAVILEHVGDLQPARDLLVQLSHLEPGNAAYRLRMAFIDVRLGDRQRAGSIVADLSDSELVGHARLLLDAAKLRAWLGMPGELELGYRGLLTGFQDPNIHLGYIGLFLTRSKADDTRFEKTIADVDCTVHLESGGERLAFTIVKGTPDAALREIALDNPITLLLIGKKRGDEVLLRDTPVEQLRYQIRDIQSKYVYAFQDTLANFSRRFPASHGVWSMQFDPTDTSNLISVLEQRSKRGSAVMEIYSRGLPLATLASLVGRSVSEVWDDLAKSGGAPIVTTFGNPNEVEEQLATLDTSDGATFDLTCLLGLRRAGVLDILPKAFERLLIAQPLADELTEELLKLSSGIDVAGSLYAEHGGIRMTQTVPDEVAQYRRDLEAIKELIFSKGQLRPTSTMLVQTQTEREQMEQVFGSSTRGAIQVAQGDKVPLCTDDAVLRAIAQNSEGLRGAGSQAVLRRMLAKELISEQKYNTALVKL